MAATSRTISRSSVPRDAEPRVATEATVRSRCPPSWPVSRHVAEAKRPPPEQHDTSGVVLPDHFCQGDSGILETPQHGPVKLEHLLLLLGGAIRPVPLRLRDGAPVNDRSTNSGSFRK
jgi:hypothetical protein